MVKEQKPISLCIFEDVKYPDLFPLSLNKAVFELFLGTDTLRARIVKELNPERVYLHCRQYLSNVLKEHLSFEETEYDVGINELSGGDVFFVNGRILAFGTEMIDLFNNVKKDHLLVKNGIPVVARFADKKAESFMDLLNEMVSDSKTEAKYSYIKEISENSSKLDTIDWAKYGKTDELIREWTVKNKIKVQETNQKLISRHWQLIGLNSDCINDDFSKIPLRGSDPESALFKGVKLINDDDIVIGSEVEVRSGTVLDATDGPILIDDNVSIEPNAVIKGPCFIGKKSIIRAGARISAGSSLGTKCKAGGKIEKTIIASYSNKQHEGFIGHSYIGSWVNIGAGTCNSDLRNNYTKIDAWNSGIILGTGRRFLGTVIGDHSKIAINTKINPGTVIGFNSNIVTNNFPPKFTPSFTWAFEPEFIEYDLDKAIDTAELMMDRRDVPMTTAVKELFLTVFRHCKQSGHTV
ncbi:MAG: putative sugar nucleotidyl transferase [Candidatus Krumholzibacteriota bacterium]|nr:putative sugar nucleotidyl transferase [Candidatus Krumholzibacteriota bacterium]